MGQRRERRDGKIYEKTRVMKGPSSSVPVRRPEGRPRSRMALSKTYGRKKRTGGGGVQERKRAEKGILGNFEGGNDEPAREVQTYERTPLP